jgi:hypothetical protein
VKFFHPAYTAKLEHFGKSDSKPQAKLAVLNLILPKSPIYKLSLRIYHILSLKDGIKFRLIKKGIKVRILSFSNPQ